MTVTQNITLDFQRVNAEVVVRAKQGDDCSRFVRIALTDGENKFTPPAGATARFRCLKPDGHSCDNPAVINDDGTVTAELTDQVLAASGYVWADLHLVGTDGQRLSTLSFLIHVEFLPKGTGVTSTNEFLTLEKMVARGQAVIDALEDEQTGVDALQQRVADLEQGGSSGGVSSWNDLTDKPFSEDSETTVILAQRELEGFAPDASLNVPSCNATFGTDLDAFTLVLGQTYRINWDGTEYPVTAQDASALFAEGALALGDVSAFGLSGNGEPFIIGWTEFGISLFSLTDL